MSLQGKSAKALNKSKRPFSSPKLVIIFTLSALVILILTRIDASRGVINNRKTRPHHDDDDASVLISRLRDSVTFLPLKDLRFAKTAMTGNTWFMSSLNGSDKVDGSGHLHFPSDQSKGRLLCIKGRDRRDGTRNSYALAWPESLPRSAKLVKGLTFVSDTYYDYGNLWHGLSAIAPFVGWSIKNKCAKPDRWLLFHWGELRDGTGLWVKNVTQATFGDVAMETFSEGDDGDTHCFEEAVVMRHNLGRMETEGKLQVSELLRCRVRAFCGLHPASRTKLTVRLTLLMRRGARSFVDPNAVIRVFSKECQAIPGCSMKVAQSEVLSFCDQVRIMTNTDVVASPHGAQLTNMLFMDRNSSVMEFFPKGWLELAGVGKYAHRWMAVLAGMNHEGAWYDTLGEKSCPNPQHDLECFKFYKGGKLGHNETFFAEWSRTVLNQTRTRKLDQMVRNSRSTPNTCAC